MASSSWYDFFGEEFSAIADVVAVTDELRSLVEDADGRLIVDVGSGSGRDSRFVRSSGGFVLPVDFSFEMCKRSSGVQSDACALPVAGDAAFGVHAWASLVHSPPLVVAKAFAEFLRVVCDGGRLVVSLKCADGSVSCADGSDTSGVDLFGREFWFYSLLEVRSLLFAAGWRSVSVHCRVDVRRPDVLWVVASAFG